MIPSSHRKGLSIPLGKGKVLYEGPSSDEMTSIENVVPEVYNKISVYSYLGFFPVFLLRTYVCVWGIEHNRSLLCKRFKDLQLQKVYGTFVVRSSQVL